MLDQMADLLYYANMVQVMNLLRIFFDPVLVFAVMFQSIDYIVVYSV
jgi:hypothetical protein